MTNLTNMLTKFVNSNTASTSGSGTLPSNTITNPKEDLKGITTRSGVAYQGPTISTTSSPPKVVERETEVTKDTVPPTNNESTKDVQPLVSIPYPLRRNNERRREKANEQIEKFYEIFKDLSFEISLADALILMPKFTLTLKALIGNKEKLSEMARTPLNEHCSAVIINKLPEKLRDPGKFLIPCDFPRMEECLALADLGASINLMPLSVWKKLSLSELTPTCMTLELADRSITQPIDDMTANRIDVIEMAYEEYSQEVLGFSDEVDAFLALEDDPTSPEVDDSYYDPEGNILLLESFLNDDPSLPPPTQGNYLPEIQKELKVCEAKTDKSSINEPPEVELKDLPPNHEYAFLEDSYGRGLQTGGPTSKTGESKTMLKRCEDTNLCLNWEKSHFMVKEGIVLGHKISKNGIEVDKAKVDVIAKLPYPTTVKGVQSFLGHAAATSDSASRLLKESPWTGSSGSGGSGEHNTALVLFLCFVFSSLETSWNFRNSLRNYAERATRIVFGYQELWSSTALHLKPLKLLKFCGQASLFILFKLSQLPPESAIYF
ncbi:reverse transcriptase domain-containing protein [Tanacetum coccineum]